MKLAYLQSFLEGEARDVVSDWSITNANYAVVWNTLIQHYENERRMVHSHLADLFSVASMRSVSSTEVKRILSEVVTTVKFLRVLGRNTEGWSDILVFILTSKMDHKTRRDWERQLGKTTQSPSFERVKTFLEGQAPMLESVEVMSKMDKQLLIATQDQVAKKHAQVKPKVNAVHATQVKSNGKVATLERKCALCSQSHSIGRCEIFIKKSINDRRSVVVSKRLCFNCLGFHAVKDCTSDKRCNTCQGKHHTLLHYVRSKVSLSSSSAASDGLNSRESMNSTEVSHAPAPGVSTSTQCTLVQSCNQVLGIPEGYGTGVFLSSVMIFVVSQSGERIKVRALIDQCSQSSFISETLAKRLKLKGKRVQAVVTSIGGKGVVKCNDQTEFTITPYFRSKFSHKVDALIVSRVSNYVPPKVFVNSTLIHLLNLELADPDFTLDYPVEVLLGADVHAEIVLGEIVKGKQGEPIATSSKLGWYISGQVPSRSSSLVSNITVSHHSASSDTLSDLLQ